MFFSILSCKNIKEFGGNNPVLSEKDLNIIAISLFINETFNCKETPCEICINNELYHDKEIIQSIDNIWDDDSNPNISFPEGLVFETQLNHSIQGYKELRFKKDCPLKFSPIIYTKDKKRLSGTASDYSGVYVFFVEMIDGNYEFKNRASIRS